MICSSLGSRALVCYLVSRCGMVMVLFLTNCMIFLGLKEYSSMWFFILAKPDVVFLTVLL